MLLDRTVLLAKDQGLVWFVLFNVSERTFGVMYDHTVLLFSNLADQQIRPQAAHIVGCQPGDFIWSLLIFLRVL